MQNDETGNENGHMVKYLFICKKGETDAVKYARLDLLGVYLTGSVQ